MPASTRNSTLYQKLHVNKYLSKATDRGGQVFPVPYSHTVVTGETGGASVGVQDKVNLCVLPANGMVVGHEHAREALGASAGAGCTLQFGDIDDDDRYMVATDSDVAGTVTGLAFTGQNYTPTVDTTVVGTWKTANPVVGKKFAGCFFVVLP